MKNSAKAGLKIIGEITLGLILAVCIATGFLAWRLAQGPINLDRATPYFVDYFNDTNNDTNTILISAPHAQRTYRYSESENTHSRDLYTGAYAQILHDLTGMPTIISKYKTDDPNFYDNIPTETVLYINSIGEAVPYKKKIN